MADSLVADFAAHGAVCARGLLDPREIEVIRSVVDEMVGHPSDRALVASRPGEPRFFEDFCNWTNHPALVDLVHRSRLADVAGALMRSRTVRLYHDHVLVKEPGAGQRTPWHQDQPYYNVDGRQNVSAWIPVDPVSRDVTLEFVEGSHDGTWYLPTTFLDRDARWFPEGTLAPVPDVEADPERFSVIGWALEPGDVVFFHMLALHAAAGNSSTAARRVLSLRFLGDDATHAPRPWPTSPEFPGLADTLAAGAPMDDERFPLLRS